jgi:hypothetical protein
MKNGSQLLPCGIEALAASYRLRIVRDPEDHTVIIPGRRGKSHLFDYGLGRLGVVVAPNAETAHWWNAARAAFRQVGVEISQDGDQEGVATFDPDQPEHVRLALKYAEVKRKRKVSEQERQRLNEVGFKKPPVSVRPGSQSESGNTVGGEKTRQKRRQRTG